MTSPLNPTDAGTITYTMSTYCSTLATDGGYDYELLGTDPDSRYECPICLLYLRDPVLTTCGHRFCESCIGKWVVKEGGRCPVDGVNLEYENIFPDNFTRREIMQCKAKCPYSKEGCTAVMPLAELEKHIQAQHMGLSYDTTPGPSSKTNSGQSSNAVVECLYKEIGCVSYIPQEQLQRHLELEVHHHLQLLTAAYKRLKVYSPSRQPELFLRQDSRESTKWLLGDTDTMDSDDYQFRRQRSWDSVRFARRFSTRPKCHERLAESEESLNSKVVSLPGKCEEQNGSGSICTTSSKSNPLKDIYERLVKLEQTDRENKIKIELLESQLSSMCKLFSTATRLTDDLTSRFCHGIYVWHIPGIHKLCNEMRNNPTLAHYSQGFYTGTFEYKVCLRFNLGIPPKPSGASSTEHPPVENDEESHASFFIHFMKGEFDGSLKWPFEGVIKLMLIHPIPELSIIESMYAQPGLEALEKPSEKINRKGVGYAYFSSLSKLFSEGFVNNDTIVCKAYVQAHVG